MLIFRMETASFVGMYHNDESTAIINDGSSHPKKWPMPHDDERFRINKKYHIEKLYPDQVKLQGSQVQCMFREWCNDLRNCGLFEFYNEDLYNFGFGSYEQLDKWISDFSWRVQLANLKVYLNVYEVPEDYAILGYTQCTFRRDKATLLHSFIATSSEQHIIDTLKIKHPTSVSADEYYKDFYNENA